MSVSASTPLTSASMDSPSSSNFTETLLAPSTTCALVTIVPSVSTTNPEPVAEPSCWPKIESELTPSDWMKTTLPPSSR